MAKQDREKRIKPPPTPSKTNPWDLPPPPKHGDPDPTMIFTSVGKALSHWELLEHHMSNIFAAFVGGKNDHQTARWAYGMVISSATRAQMLQGAAHIFFLGVPDSAPARRGFPSLKEDLEKIMTTFGGLAGRRNNIAHGIVNPYFIETADVGGDGYCLVPPLYATKQYQKRMVYPYAFTAAMIDNFTELFGNLSVEAKNYALRLRSQVPY